MRRRGDWRYSWWRRKPSAATAARRFGCGGCFFAVCLICEHQRRDPDRRRRKPGPVDAEKYGRKLCITDVLRAWMNAGDAWRNRCLPPDRRSRAGLPSRDRGRRAQGTGDRRAAVAEVCFVDAGRQCLAMLLLQTMQPGFLILKA